MANKTNPRGKMPELPPQYRAMLKTLVARLHLPEEGKPLLLDRVRLERDYEQALEAASIDADIDGYIGLASDDVQTLLPILMEYAVTAHNLLEFYEAYFVGLGTAALYPGDPLGDQMMEVTLEHFASLLDVRVHDDGVKKKPDAAFLAVAARNARAKKSEGKKAVIFEEGVN